MANNSDEFFGKFFYFNLPKDARQAIEDATTVPKSVTELRRQLGDFGIDVSKLSEEDVFRTASEEGLLISKKLGKRKIGEETKEAFRNAIIKNYKDNARISQFQLLKNFDKMWNMFVSSQRFPIDTYKLNDERYDLSSVFEPYVNSIIAEEGLDALPKTSRALDKLKFNIDTGVRDSAAKYGQRIDYIIDSSIKKRKISDLAILGTEIEEQLAKPTKDRILKNINSLLIKRKRIYDAIKHLEKRHQFKNKTTNELKSVLSLKGVEISNLKTRTQIINAAKREGVGLREWEKGKEDKILDIIKKTKKYTIGYLKEQSPERVDVLWKDIEQTFKKGKPIYLKPRGLPVKEERIKELYEEQTGKEDFDTIFDSIYTNIQNKQKYLTEEQAWEKARKIVRAKALETKAPLANFEWKKRLGIFLGREPTAADSLEYAKKPLTWHRHNISKIKDPKTKKALDRLNINVNFRGDVREGIIKEAERELKQEEKYKKALVKVTDTTFSKLVDEPRLTNIEKEEIFEGFADTLSDLTFDEIKSK